MYLTFPLNRYRRGSQRNVRHLHKAVQFGDGYEQVESAGINTLQFEFTAEFTALEEAQRNQIVTFLNERKSVEPFYFAFEGEPFILVRCTGFTDSTGDGDLWRVSVQLKRHFRPDE